MNARDLIVVDIETTGLDPERCAVLEIAAINATTGDRLHIVPTIGFDFSISDAPALAVNRYFERRIWERQQDLDIEIDLLKTLLRWLDGNTLGGSNPRFDLACLVQHCKSRDLVPVPNPHHRLADLAAFAAGHSQALMATELPGLGDVCSMLGVTNAAPHSAMGDAEATLACFRKMHEVISA